VDKVQTLHNHYLDVLAYEIQNTHPHNHSRVLINIFRILPMMGPLSLKQAQIVGSFSPDKPGGKKFVIQDGCSVWSWALTSFVWAITRSLMVAQRATDGRKSQ
jgi:hypothetical protein